MNKSPVARLGGSWIWHLLYGLISIVTGAVAVAWPGPTLIVLAVVFGAQLVTTGVFRLVGSAGMGDTGTARALTAVLGVVSLLLGLYAIRHVLITVLALGLLLGIYWMVDGFTAVFAALDHSGLPGRGGEHLHRPAQRHGRPDIADLAGAVVADTVAAGRALVGHARCHATRPGTPDPGHHTACLSSVRKHRPQPMALLHHIRAADPAETLSTCRSRGSSGRTGFLTAPMTTVMTNGRSTTTVRWTYGSTPVLRSRLRSAKSPPVGGAGHGGPITFADLSGDGRDGYLAVTASNVVYAWFAVGAFGLALP